MAVRLPLRRPLASVGLALGLAAAGLTCSSPSEPPRIAALQLPVTAVALDALGATRALSAIARDAGGRQVVSRDVSWSSTVPGVATVSADGVVTAVSEGTTVVSAAVAGLSASATVTVDQVPVAPVRVGGNLQSATVGTALAQPIAVRIEDRLGSPIAGEPVRFLVESGGGTLSDTLAGSDAAGLATTTWTLGTSTVAPQRLAVSVGLAASVTRFDATAIAGPAAQFRIPPGSLADGQVGVVGQAVPLAPAVELLDANGNGVAGAPVTFRVTGGGGSASGANAVTNGAGIATVGAWVLGATPGVNTLQAEAAGFAPLSFTANGVLDPCAPDVATPIAVGSTVSGSLATTDCRLGTGQYYDQYRLEVGARTAFVMDMASATVDTWLSVYAVAGGTLTLIAENDDIQRGIITDSRVGVTLDPGMYVLRARSWGSGETGPYTLVVRTATLGEPARMVLLAGQGQTAAPGAAVATPPAVRILDETDAPVPGVTVQFATVPGVGSVSGANAVTDANGVAMVGGWTLAEGANALSASVAGATLTGAPVVFSARGDASGAGFDVHLRFTAMPTLAQLQTFSTAAARWESVITGDLPANPLSIDVGDCDSPYAIDEVVDDVIIVVRLEEIDGPGQVLGSAGPCFVREGPSFLPILGVMRFDTADLAGLEANGNFGTVILHEMGHVLGIGTIWSAKGLLQSPSTATTTLDTHFSGAFAIQAFNAIGGATYTGGNRVPVENRPDSAGRSYAGTRNAHWRETVLRTELMTGFLDPGVANPLSLLTVQSLRDLGYTVDPGAADAFAVITTLRAEGAQAGPLFLQDDVRRGRLIRVDRRGRLLDAPERARPKGAR